MISFDHGSVSLTRDGKNLLFLTFCLGTGDFALLLGPNGSGKTTILDLIAGVRRLESGRLILGNELNEPIAYAVQDANSGILPWKNTIENILLPSTLCPGSNGSDAPKLDSLLRKFRLFEKQYCYPYQLSGGEKQAINLLRTALTPSRIVLIDEVFSSLHADLKEFAKEIVRDVAEKKTTILITHDASDLDLPANRYLSITEGHVIDVNRQEAERILRNDV